MTIISRERQHPSVAEIYHETVYFLMQGFNLHPQNIPLIQEIRDVIKLQLFTERNTGKCKQRIG